MWAGRAARSVFSKLWPGFVWMALLCGLAILPASGCTTTGHAPAPVISSHPAQTIGSEGDRGRPSPAGPKVDAQRAVDIGKAEFLKRHASLEGYELEVWPDDQANVWVVSFIWAGYVRSDREASLFFVTVDMSTGAAEYLGSYWAALHKALSR